MGELEGKVALITGSARGTGAATARLFAQEGARVAVTDVRDELGAEVAAELGDAGMFVHLDVTDEGQWASAVETVEARFGKLDVVVNNAAVLHIAPIATTSVEDFNRVITVNETGVFLGIRSAIEPMRRAGGGSIVNISSIDGVTAFPMVVAYCASKWAVRGITRTAALELGPLGIRVNAVCPQHGNPELVRGALPPEIASFMEGLENSDAAASYSVLGRRGELVDISHMIVFLASDRSAYCTGGDFPVDGGASAGHNVGALAPSST